MKVSKKNIKFYLSDLIYIILIFTKAKSADCLPASICDLCSYHGYDAFKLAEEILKKSKTKKKGLKK